MSISVIVPVYNVEKYLDRCVCSILKQSFKNIEVILVNDGSTDASPDICNYYASIDDRVKVIHKENGGLSDARNKGLDIAKGKYISFIDSDDYIHPKMLEILYYDIENNDAQISCCGLLKVQEYEEVKITKVKKDDSIQILNGIDLIPLLATEIQYIVAWNKIYRRDLFNNLRYKFGVRHEDEYLIHHLLLKTNIFTYRQQPLYYYVQRQGSIMHSQSGIINIDKLGALRNRYKLFKKCSDRMLLTSVQAQYISFFFTQYLIYIKSDDKNQKKIMKNFILIFIWDLIDIVRNPKFRNKEKIAWAIFIIFPSIYSRYTS